MYTTHFQTVRCPNCGSSAQRRYFNSFEATYRSCQGNQVIQTECRACDYLMVMCSLNGSVVEAHAPGTPAPNHPRNFNRNPAIASQDNWQFPSHATC